MACYLGFQPTDEKDYYFISYNSEDVGKIGPIVQKLNDSAVPLWYDYGLEYGEKWEGQISGKIKDAKAIILFFTKGVLNKKESYVRKEYDMATKFYEKKVYVVLLDKINKADVPSDMVPWWMDVEYRHCIDAYESGNIENLCEEIKKAIKFEKKIVTKNNRRISIYNDEKSINRDIVKNDYSKIDLNNFIIESFSRQDENSIHPNAQRKTGKSTDMSISDDTTNLFDLYRKEAKKFEKSGDSRKAIEVYKIALDVAKKNWENSRSENTKNDFLTVCSALGTLYAVDGDFEESKRYYEGLYDFLKDTFEVKVEDEKQCFAMCCNMLGALYLKSNYNDKAKALFKEGIDALDYLKQESTKVKIVKKIKLAEGWLCANSVVGFDDENVLVLGLISYNTQTYTLCVTLPLKNRTIKVYKIEQNGLWEKETNKQVAGIVCYSLLESIENKWFILNMNSKEKNALILDIMSEIIEMET
ncbi:MAG: toll/interleukin-1 receptor domain-containing protein [Oscillospiraceae bacterium]|nr:toll/interleukin-1 receptor domain-containing protein [Oscillospiraceae bacterium]